MYARTNRCYNERGSRTNYVRSSIPNRLLHPLPQRHGRFKDSRFCVSQLNDVEIGKQDRQCTYNVTLRRRSRNHCCSGKVMIITQTECVFVALHVSYCHLWLAQPYNIFPQCHKWHDFRKKKKVIEHKMRVCSASTTVIRNIFLSKQNWARYDQKCIWAVMYSLFLSDFKENRIFFEFFFSEKYRNIKYHENPSRRRRVVPCGQTEGRTWQN
jgi:hypothetical protein